jgi:hypothetical protein
LFVIVFPGRMLVYNPHPVPSSHTKVAAAEGRLPVPTLLLLHVSDPSGLVSAKSMIPDTCGCVSNFKMWFPIVWN